MIIEVNIAKAGKSVTFDTDTLPRESVAYATQYGFTQCIVDTVAGVARKDFDSDESFRAAAWEKAKKRVDQLNSGNVPTARVPADPKTVEARKNAATLMAAGVTADEIAAFLAARSKSPESGVGAIETKLVKGKKSA